MASLQSSFYNSPEMENRAKLSGNTVLHYGHWHGARPGRGSVIDSDRAYSSFGPGARKRLRECLSRWFDTVRVASEFLRVPVVPLRNHTFITLTLSSRQIHCDKLIKRECLNHFLIYLKRHYGVVNYIWKAELQQNGNIHYHLITDKYVPHEELRALWNTAQNRLGYVDMFEKHDNPNSTDIHSLRKVKNVMAYVAKYMTKKESTLRPICGHSWGRSDTVAALLPFSLSEDESLQDWFKMQTDSVDHRQFSGDRFLFTTFFQKVNLRSLPAHHLTEIKRIATDNLYFLQKSHID